MRVTSSPSFLSGRVIGRRVRPQLVSRESGLRSGHWKLVGDGVIKEKMTGVEEKFFLSLPQVGLENDLPPHFNNSVLVLINRPRLFVPG